MPSANLADKVIEVSVDAAPRTDRCPSRAPRMIAHLHHLLGRQVSLEDLSAALEDIPMALSFARMDDQAIVYRNRTFKRVFGYEPTEFKTIYDWFEAALPFPEDVALTLERWAPFVIAGTPAGKSVEPMEVRILCKDGTIKNALHSGIAIPHANCILATFVDLSSTRRDRPSYMVDLPAARAVDAAARLLPELPPPSPSPSPWETLFAERKRQSEALKRSAELLDRTGRLAEVGGWELDLVTEAISWTDETRRIHAVPVDFQPTLQSALAFYNSESRHLIRNAIEHTIYTGDPWDVEAPLTRADGIPISVRTRGFAEFADGKPIRLFGAIQDITSRVARQNALELANERLVLATATGQIGIFDWDLLTNCAVWDDRMYRLYGLDPERGQASLEAWLGRLHPEDRERAHQCVANAVASGAVYEDEFRVLWPDGSLHHIRGNGQAKHADGQPTRFVGVNWDVTEQRRLVMERADQDELFRITLESIGDGVITTDADTRVRWMNPVAERLTGWSIAEAKGLLLADIFRLIHEETRLPVLEPLARCLAQGEAMTLAPNTLLLSRDGAEIGIDDSAAPIRDARGAILGVVLVFHDVTEQRRLAREARRMLKLDLQMKDDFLSHVSHELRSPLASIYSFANILADGLAGEMTPAQTEYLDIILKNSRQLRSMIEDLLQVTRSETGKLSIDLRPTSLVEAVTESMKTLQGGATAKGITLAADCPADLPPVDADPTRLRQVLIIILDNATKFTPADGSVHLTVRPSPVDPDMLQVCVADTGCGIDPEGAERIFEHLYQVSKPGQEGRKGLGLGLYIARDLVLRQGGTIWVKSDPGKGSEFYFTLPVCSGLARSTTRNHWGAERRKIVSA